MEFYSSTSGCAPGPITTPFFEGQENLFRKFLTNCQQKPADEMPQFACERMLRYILQFSYNHEIARAISITFEYENDFVLKMFLQSPAFNEYKSVLMDAVKNSLNQFLEKTPVNEPFLYSVLTHLLEHFEKEFENENDLRFYPRDFHREIVGMLQKKGLKDQAQKYNQSVQIISSKHGCSNDYVAQNLFHSHQV